MVGSTTSLLDVRRPEFERWFVKDRSYKALQSWTKLRQRARILCPHPPTIGCGLSLGKGLRPWARQFSLDKGEAPRETPQLWAVHRQHSPRLRASSLRATEGCTWRLLHFPPVPTEGQGEFRWNKITTFRALPQKCILTHPVISPRLFIIIIPWVTFSLRYFCLRLLFIFRNNNFFIISLNFFCLLFNFACYYYKIQYLNGGRNRAFSRNHHVYAVWRTISLYNLRNLY